MASKGPALAFHALKIGLTEHVSEIAVSSGYVVSLM